MPRSKRIDLSTFDDRLLNGLLFCKRVYDFFDQARRDPDGISNLRLRKTKAEKRLLEELIPVAHYIQARYREGRKIKVRWLSGSQPYDGILLSSGSAVDHEMCPRRLQFEVTTAVHPNDYLVRELIDKGGGAFSPKTTYRDRKTGKVVSEPYVRSNDEHLIELAEQIKHAIQKKVLKQHPSTSLLIVNCVPNFVLLDNEWSVVIERVKESRIHERFAEVFIFEIVPANTATLHGKRAGKS